MIQSNFNENDPWHREADFVFFFACRNCDASIDLDWKIADKDFSGACVELSTRAQRLGWTTEADGPIDRFYCPACSTRRNKR